MDPFWLATLLLAAGLLTANAAVRKTDVERIPYVGAAALTAAWLGAVCLTPSVYAAKPLWLFITYLVVVAALVTPTVVVFGITVIRQHLQRPRRREG